MIKITIRTSDLGGTNWTAEIARSADLNDTFGAVTLHRKQFSDATERTTTSTAYVDSGTEFTLSVPVNSIIIGMYISIDITHKDEVKTASAPIQITGVNLGSFYPTSNYLLGSTYAAQYFSSSEGVFASHTTTAGDEGVYVTKKATISQPLKILDASTTIKIRISSSSGATFGAAIRNVAIDIIYIETFKED